MPWFSIFLGVFNGAVCSVERLRGGTKDWVNSYVGGFCAAGVFGLRNPNPVHMLMTCTFTGAFTGFVFWLRPIPPTAAQERW